MRKHCVFAASLFALGLNCSGCNDTGGKIERKSLKYPNTTSHVFQLPLNYLKDTLVTLFNFANQYEDPDLRSVFYYYPSGDKEHKQLVTFNAETTNDSVFGNDYFKKSNTENDIYLHDFGSVWESPLYQVDGKPLEYRTVFALKLKSVDASRTRLVIEAENPVVINGTAGMGPHGFIAREEKVEPTTIEEHLLLLYIAKKLSDNSVAPVIWPAP